MARTRQLDEWQRLHEGNRRIIERAEQYVKTVSPDQLLWQPGDGSWGIGRILEHLCVSDSRYLEKIRKYSDATEPAIPSNDTVWIATLTGIMLVQALTTSAKLPAPGALRPTEKPRPYILSIFLEYHKEIQALLERTRMLDWNRIVVPSPVSSLFRMNLGDSFNVLVRHAERHFGQIEQVRKKQGFPL